MKRIALALVGMAALVGWLSSVRAAHVPCYCPIPGYQCPPEPNYLTPNFPMPRPLFNGGAPFAPDFPDSVTVIRLNPIFSGPPMLQPRERPITDEVVRPNRPTLPESGPIPPSDIRPRPDLPQGSRQPELSGRVYVLLLADAAAKDAGKTHVAGAALFEQLLQAGIRKDKFGQVEKLNEGGLDSDTILKKLAEMSVQPDDALVIYYAGAAIYDESSQGVVLAPSASKKLPREELKKAALEKKARFTVLLTDSASNAVIADPPGKPASPEPGMGALEPWFLGYRGIVDMHAASVGEFAAGRGVHGGCFTVAFVREFGRPAGTWGDMLESVKFTTNNLFKSYRLEVLKSDDTTPLQKATYRNQESQVPVALTSPDNIISVRPNAKAAPQQPATEPIGLAPVEIKAGPPARISVRLPAEAQLWIDGKPTPQVGSERTFELPAGPGEGDTLCELRMEVNNWFGIYRITVSPGKTSMVDLQVPPSVTAEQKSEGKINTSAK